MNIEIERKFLVKGFNWKKDPECVFQGWLEQGYLADNDVFSIRIRSTSKADGTLTIKSVSAGMTRKEFEYTVPEADSAELLSMCRLRLSQYIVSKCRYQFGPWTIDEFTGDNSGLVIAEIELDSEDQQFDKPDWLGEEVTSDRRYYNSWLAQNPYLYW